jgi:hypothetical protein
LDWSFSLLLWLFFGQIFLLESMWIIAPLVIFEGVEYLQLRQNKLLGDLG